MQNDIAIFRTELSKESEDSPPGIDLLQLQSFDEIALTSHDQYIDEYPLWTVGYSAKNPLLEGSTLWDNLLKEKDNSAAKFQSVRSESFSHLKLFNYQLYKYYEVLRQNEDARSLYDKVRTSLSVWDDSEPRFEQIFMADHRALAVGSFTKIPDDGNTNTKTTKIYHNMNGFLGNSGGMVCHFQGADKSKPKVIGLCKENLPYSNPSLKDANGLSSPRTTQS